MYMGYNQNKIKKVKYSDIRTLYGNWEYKYATGILSSRQVTFMHMRSKIRLRYGNYIFYINEYPVVEDGVKMYNVTCAITGFSIACSQSNDESVLKQAFLDRLNTEGFARYESSVRHVCNALGLPNPLSKEIEPSTLMLIL